MSPKANLSSLVRRGVVVGAHVVLWTCAYYGAFLLRFDGSIPPEHRRRSLYGLAILLGLRIVFFWVTGLFHGILRYAGIPEVRSIVRATSFATVAFGLAGLLIRPVVQPRSIYIGEWILAILAASGLRLAVRVFRERGGAKEPASASKRVILIGAGDAGEMFLRDLERVPRPHLVVVGLLDDDRTKHGSSVRGVRVLGPINETTLRRAGEDLDAHMAILAMPTASGHRTREVMALCQSLGIELKTLPSIHQILSGDVKVSMLRDVAIEDLLRREPIHLHDGSMEQLLRGKRVLVTGGAGSIGSELARQAARYAPSGLALLDHNENGLFFLEREIRTSFPNIQLTPIIADIKDTTRIRDVMRTFRPQVVLHAAAHKHVPMMEANPGEAIKNNVFGTCVVADLANAFGVETFVLISTDKAVNPTSVMGASKRIAEMYVQSLSQRARTRFAAVRFGNVLGSAGSVVQLFREQIAAGGPVTVTHPEMQRYFMTIPEATQLVLQAGALARGGEIFLLDMGEPVKIVDLARDMIRMSGLEPDVDVPIIFSGSRPGEKLFEELFHSSEAHDSTQHPKVFVGKIAPVETTRMDSAIQDLVSAVQGTPEDVRRAIIALVPEARFENVKDPSEVEAAMERTRPLDTLGLPVAARS